MAIDRIPFINLAPLIAQRLDLSNITPLAPSSVPALVPLAPYTPALMEPGADGSYLPRSAAGSPSAAASTNTNATPHDSSAMQANQLFFSRQLVSPAPDAAILAASWRVMIKTYGERRAALQEQARGLHVPGSVFMAEQNPALLREGPRPPLIMDAEAWRFAVYGWGGQRMMLRVLAGDPDEPAAPKRRHGKVALRLELMLADLGRVVIQMEPVTDGILLELAATEAAALQHMRRVLPDMVQVIGRSGLRIVRCRLSRELHSVRVHDNYPMQATAASLTLPVFRAMSEVALLLSQPALAYAGPAQEQAAPVQEHDVPVQKLLPLEPLEPELDLSLQRELAPPAPMN